jgi:hypothetical protein
LPHLQLHKKEVLLLHHLKNNEFVKINKYKIYWIYIYDKNIHDPTWAIIILELKNSIWNE